MQVVCDGDVVGQLHESGETVHRDGAAAWSKVEGLPRTNSTIHTVHMIYMNHYGEFVGTRVKAVG